MFSFKALFERVFGHGRRAVIHAKRSKIQELPKKALKLNQSPIAEGTANNQLRCGFSSQESLGGSLFQYLGPITNRLFQGLVKKVPTPIWVEARRKTTKRLFGETAPYFALVGVTLVSGPEQGFLTAKDELEALCGDIRDAISRVGWIHNPDYWNATPKQRSSEEHIFSLEDLELGPMIDKGCNAVVYSAKWKQASRKEETTSFDQEIFKQERNSGISSNILPSEEMPKISKIEALDLDKLDLMSSTLGEFIPPLRARHLSMCQDLNFLGFSGFEKPMGKASSTAEPSSSKSKKSTEEPSRASPALSEHPLAVKMLFNYEAESNAPSILSAMYKELLPAKTIQLEPDLLPWKENFLKHQSKLPWHKNIVEMPCVFVDRVPLLEGGMELYPQALPNRIHPMGFGRNASLFCVMKRYDCTLSEFMNKYEPSIRTSCLLLTQLLEAIEHLQRYNVAHRDLKSDNILLSFEEGMDSPMLVLSDFGCSLSTSNMKAPFPSYEADPRLGNVALMAPEVKGCVPGVLTSVKFSSSDLWAAGALAYEIFGLENPFVGRRKESLDSLHYKESQLPKLPKNIPSALRHLIIDLLKKNPKQRPSATTAATICQLCLWGPSKWLNKHSVILPSHSEVTRWLLCLSTKILCEAGRPSAGGKLEYEIVSTFLGRVRYEDIIQAIKWFRIF